MRRRDRPLCLEPDTYFITVTVEDGFGGTDTTDAMRVVFDPSESGGFLPDDGPETGRGLPGGAPGHGCLEYQPVRRGSFKGRGLSPVRLD